MRATDNNNYIESKSLLDRAKSKGVAYDHVDWEQLQGYDLVYEDRVRRLDRMIGKTYTSEEMDRWDVEEEKYQSQYDEWVLSNPGFER